jgi:hypothetical protein
MNNFVQSYKIILKALQENCTHIESYSQVRRPKLSNLEVVALDLTAEYMSLNSELQLFMAIAGTTLAAKIERSVYNRRRRRLFDYTNKVRLALSQKFSHLTNLFIIDSAPVEVCKAWRANRSKICATPEIQPNVGYCAAKKMRCFGCKMHLICDENGVVHSFDFTPAAVHDVNFLKDVKYTLSRCELIGDKGCISAGYRPDLFTHGSVKLTVPSQKNQHAKGDFSPVKRRKGKRMETLISQLYGQFSMNVNFAKTFAGLATRMLAKITAITIVQ